MKIQVQMSPNAQELYEFLETTFNDINEADKEKFNEENSQNLLSEWFDVPAMIEYAQTQGVLIEARDEEAKLAGCIFVGKQNPVSWPDGKKAELFILAVAKEYRQKGLGRDLVKSGEEEVKKMGGKKIITNTHVLMETVQQFYEKVGYEKMGILENYYDNGNAIFYSKNI